MWRAQTISLSLKKDARKNTADGANTKYCYAANRRCFQPSAALYNTEQNPLCAYTGPALIGRQGGCSGSAFFVAGRVVLEWIGVDNDIHHLGVVTRFFSDAFPLE